MFRVVGGSWGPHRDGGHLELGTQMLVLRLETMDSKELELTLDQEIQHSHS